MSGTGTKNLYSGSGSAGTEYLAGKSRRICNSLNWFRGVTFTFWIKIDRKNIFPKINSKIYKFSVFFPARSSDTGTAGTGIEILGSCSAHPLTLLFYLLLLLCCVSTEPSRNLPFSLIISNVIIIPPSSWMSQKCFNLGGVVIISNVIYLRVIVIPSSSWMSPQRAPPTPCLWSGKSPPRRRSWSEKNSKVDFDNGDGDDNADDGNDDKITPRRTSWSRGSEHRDLWSFFLKKKVKCMMVMVMVMVMILPPSRRSWWG